MAEEVQTLQPSSRDQHNGLTSCDKGRETVMLTVCSGNFRADRSCCRSINPVKINTIFKPIQTLRQILTKVKNEVPKGKKYMKFHVGNVNRVM